MIKKSYIWIFWRFFTCLQIHSWAILAEFLMGFWTRVIHNTLYDEILLHTELTSFKRKTFLSCCDYSFYWLCLIRFFRIKHWDGFHFFMKLVVRFVFQERGMQILTDLFYRLIDTCPITHIFLIIYQLFESRLYLVIIKSSIIS